MDNQPPVIGKGTGKKKRSAKRTIKYILLFLLAVFIVLTTAIAHIFGPYEGKVVDLATGKPLEGAAVLIVSSELDEVMALSDRILVMYRGKIVGEFDPKKDSTTKIGLAMLGGTK